MRTNQRQLLPEDSPQENLTLAGITLKAPLLGFFAVAAALLAGIVVLIFRDRDSMAALILRQPMPNRPSTQHSDADESTAAAAGR